MINHAESAYSIKSRVGELPVEIVTCNELNTVNHHWKSSIAFATLSEMTYNKTNFTID